MALLVVMIITSSLQLRASLTGTPKPLLIHLQLAPRPGHLNRSQVLLEVDHSSVIRLQEVPIELQMLMPSDMPASALDSTQHQI